MDNQPKTPALYTVKEVADLLRVHARTAYRLIIDGHLQAIKIGSQWRVSETALLEYLDSGWRVAARRRKPEKGPRQLSLPLEDD